jgi:hypothetical protein
MGRPGWFVDEHRNRLRLLSHELPLRPGEVLDPERAKTKRSLYLEALPGPNTTAAAITELCAIFDGVIAGTWSWPDQASLLSKADPSQPITSASIEDRGQEAAAAQLGDAQIDVAHLGGELPGPVAIAVAKPLLTALMALRAEHGSDLKLDQLLQAVAYELGDQLPSCAAIE